MRKRRRCFLSSTRTQLLQQPPLHPPHICDWLLTHWCYSSSARWFWMSVFSLSALSWQPQEPDCALKGKEEQVTLRKLAKILYRGVAQFFWYQNDKKKPSGHEVTQLSISINHQCFIGWMLHFFKSILFYLSSTFVFQSKGQQRMRHLMLSISV